MGCCSSKHGRVQQQLPPDSATPNTCSPLNGGIEGDEGGFKLSSHLFVPGEYISIRDDEGELHTFRVITVDDI